jgi:RNA polymerase sigma-70 factor (ECF subfamily)
VQGRSASVEDDHERQSRVVHAFLAASRQGDFDALLQLLDPEVMFRKDAAAVLATSGRQGAPEILPELRGGHAVAQTFSGRARGARAALIDGRAGAAWAPGGKPQAVFMFTVLAGRIVAIDLVADPARIDGMHIQLAS